MSLHFRPCLCLMYHLYKPPPFACVLILDTSELRFRYTLTHTRRAFCFCRARTYLCPLLDLLYRLKLCPRNCFPHCIFSQYVQRAVNFAQLKHLRCKRFRECRRPRHIPHHQYDCSQPFIDRLKHNIIAFSYFFICIFIKGLAGLYKLLCICIK